MSLNRFITAAAKGAIVGGGVSAIVTAAAGATGAAIMSSAGHEGYSVSEAAEIGAIGGAILGGASSAISRGAAAIGFFGNSNDQSNSGCFSNALTYTGGSVIAGLIGYGVLNSSGTTAMELGQTAAAFAVGGLATMIPAHAAFCCICVPLGLAALCAMTLEDTEDENLRDSSYSSVPVSLKK